MDWSPSYVNTTLFAIPEPPKGAATTAATTAAATDPHSHDHVISPASGLGVGFLDQASGHAQLDQLWSLPGPWDVLHAVHVPGQQVSGPFIADLVSQVGRQS